MRRMAPLCLILLMASKPAGAQMPPPRQIPVDQLKQDVVRIARGIHADWGIYIKSLDTGEEVAIDADTPMETMSVIKVPLLVTAFRQIDAGKLSLADPVTMRVADKRFGTGVLRVLHDGLTITVEDALTLMIIQSDNTATDMMYAKVGGPAVVTETMRQLGFSSILAARTSFEWFRALAAFQDPAYANVTPADLFERGNPLPRPGAVAEFNAQGKTPFGLASVRDIGGLLEKIARGQAASQDSCRKMLAILRMQQMRTRIPKYVSGAAIGHKTGDWPPYIANDVGIIQSPRANFVLAIFNNHYDGLYPVLEDAVARIAQEAWIYFSFRGPSPTANAAGPAAATAP